jgi:hypothetical protein
VDQSPSLPSCIFGSNKRFGDDQPRLLQKERVGVANSVSVVRLGGLCEKVFVLRVGFGGCGVPESGCRWDGMEITQRCGTETWTWRTGRWFDMSGTLNTMMG